MSYNHKTEIEMKNETKDYMEGLVLIKEKQQLVSDIINEKTQLKQRTLFIIGNPVSMNIAQRFKHENLNRLFCGKYHSISPCYEKYRAEKLEQYVTDFFSGKNSELATDDKAINHHYDLHTGIRHSTHEKCAIYPYQNDKPHRS